MAAGTRVGSIYVSVGADYTQYAKDLNFLKQQAKADGLAISNSLNNAISPSQAHKSITSLNSALAQLSATAKAPSDAFRTTSDQISKSLSSVAQAAGMSEQAFARLNERIMRGQAMQNAERAMSGIAKTAGLSAKEVDQLARQMGFSQIEAAALASRFQTVDKSLQGAGKSARSLTTILNTTVSILAGMAIGTVIDAIARGFGGAVKSAFSFNQTIEQSRIGIASLERTFAGIDMQGSFKEAEEVQKRLQVAALETTATYEELLRALQEGIGPALREGFDASQIVEFTTLMTQAAASISLPMDQLGQELRAILDATIDRNARIAKVLQITNEDVKGWREAGTLFDELKKRLQEFGAAGEQMSHTFTGAFSNLKDAMQMALGTGLEGTFVSTTAAIEKFRDQIVTIDSEAGTFTFDERLKEAFSGVDDSLSALIGAISESDLIGKIVAVADAISSLADVIVFLSNLSLPDFRIPPSWERIVDILGKLGSAWTPDILEKFAGTDVSKTSISDINEGWASGNIQEMARIEEILDKMESLKGRISARAGGQGGFRLFPDASADIEEIKRLEAELANVAATLPASFESAGSEIKRVVVDGSIDQVVRENYVQSWDLIAPAVKSASDNIESTTRETNRKVTDEDRKAAKEKVKAIADAAKSAARQQEELTDKIKQLTLSEVEYKRWALGQELSDRQAAGAKAEQLEQYKALRLQEIADEAAKKEMDDRRDKAKEEVDLLRDRLKEESDLREEYEDELFELTHTEEEIYEKSVDEKIKSLKRLGLSEGELARYKTLLLEKNKKENDDLTKFIEQRWEHALDAVQDGLAEWIKTGEFSFDKLVDLFKDMLAEILAAWIMTKGKMVIADLFDGGDFNWGGLFGGSNKGGGGSNILGLINNLSDLFTSDSTGLSLYDYISEGEILQGISDIYGSGSGGGGGGGGGGTGVVGTAITAGKAIYSYLAEETAATAAEAAATEAAAATGAEAGATAAGSETAAASGSSGWAVAGWAAVALAVLDVVYNNGEAIVKPVLGGITRGIGSLLGMEQKPHQTLTASTGGTSEVIARSEFKTGAEWAMAAQQKLWGDMMSQQNMTLAARQSGMYAADPAGMHDVRGQQADFLNEIRATATQAETTLKILAETFGDQLAGMLDGVEATVPGFDHLLDVLSGTNVSAGTAAKALQLATRAYDGNRGAMSQLISLLRSLGMSEQQAAAAAQAMISSVQGAGQAAGQAAGMFGSAANTLLGLGGAAGVMASSVTSSIGAMMRGAEEASRQLSTGGSSPSGSSIKGSVSGSMVVAPKGTSSIYGMNVNVPGSNPGNLASFSSHAVGGIYLQPTLMADAYGNGHEVAEAGWSEAILPLPGGPRTMDEIYSGVKQLATQSQQPIIVKVQLPEKIAVMVGQKEIEGVITDIADKQAARREQSLIRSGQPACR